MRMGGRKLLNDYGRCPSKNDVQEYFEDWLELMGKHAPDLLTNQEEMYYRALDVLPVDLEDEIVLKDDIKSYEHIHNFIIKKYAHKKHRAQQRQIITSRGKPSRMSPVVAARDEPGATSSTSPMPSYEDIVAMTVAAFQSGNQRPPKRSDKDRRPPSKDKPKFWFDKDCWECGKNGHKRPDCPDYQALLAKSDGKRPKGHKGAFDKARDEFRRKHGGSSRTPSRERKDKDKKNERSKAIKQLREAEDSESESDSDAEGADLKTLKCSDARTNVFALRTRSRSTSSETSPPRVRSSSRERNVPEIGENLALFRSLDQMSQRAAWSARMRRADTR